MSKEKKPKPKYVDDGHTIYSMENLPQKGFRPTKEPREKLAPKERWAAIRAAFEVYGIPFLIAVAGFAVAAVLVWLWLK